MLHSFQRKQKKLIANIISCKFDSIQLTGESSHPTSPCVCQKDTHNQPQQLPRVLSAAMLNSRNSTSAGKQYDTSPRESGDDSEDESEILEESPCGRWLKRREEVDQRDVPGIDCVHLAMDTEEGVEVVWSEMQLSENTDLKEQEVQMRQIFESLLHLDHENIVKFHRYWTDMKSDKPRVSFSFCLS